jgi:hypothetical protein
VIGIFKQKNPTNILILLIFGVLVKFPMFLHPHMPEVSGKEGIFFKAIVNAFNSYGKENPYFYPVVTFSLLFIQAVLLNQFMNNQRMMSRSSYFPGMAFILVTSLIPEWNYFSAPLIINIILLIILIAIFRTYNQERAKGAIFNIGLALGIASFLFLPSLTFIIWILIAMMLMRPFRLNEWIICLVGVITPYYFLTVYLFITDSFSWQKLIPSFSLSFPLVKQSGWLAGSMFLLTVPFLAGGFFVQDSLRRMLIQVRKGWSLILLFLLGAVFIPFINSNDTFANWVLVAFPFAAFHASTYFYARLRIIPLLLFWLTILFILCYQYIGPGW